MGLGLVFDKPPFNTNSSKPKLSPAVVASADLRDTLA
jgi:hypothetical protein